MGSQLTSPGNFQTVTSYQSASIDLSWDPVHGATSYKIQRSPAYNFISNFTTIETIPNGLITNYTDRSNLINAETYYYQIAACDHQSTSPYSSIKPAIPQLARPDNFNALTSHDSASIDLSWKFVIGATAYQIQRSSTNNDAAAFTTIATISDRTLTNYVDTSNLINGQTYYYKIAAADGQSTGRFSLIVHAVPKFAPPSNFTAVTSQQNASIDLYWSSVVGATSYEIQRSPAYNDIPSFTRIQTISDMTMTNYVDTSNLINGKTYYYKIAACNGRSTGRFSSVVYAIPALRPPGNLTAVTGRENNSIDLSWASVAGATSYEIQRSPASSFIPNFTTIAPISNQLITNYTDNLNLINGQTYYYKIAACDAQCETSFSVVVHAVPALRAPRNFTAVTSRQSASIDLSWASVVGATCYEIQRYPAYNFIPLFTKIKTVSDTTMTNYTDESNLINGKTYYYKISASDSRSTTSFSSLAHAIPTFIPPASLTAVTGEESASIDLSWASVAGGTGYEIQRSSTEDAGGVFITIATVSNGTTTNYVDKSNLINGQTYYYKIAARNGRFSLTVDAVPKLAPPNNLTAIPGQDSGSLDISWSSVAGATSYEIQRSRSYNNEADFNTIATISNTRITNYVDKSTLINGHIYCYKIAASDGRSTGRYSLIAHAVPAFKPPDNFKAVTGQASASIDLSWASVVGATDYEIQRSSTKNSGGAFITIAIVSNTMTTNYVDQSHLINGQTYYYKIVARDGGSIGRFSLIVHAVPALRPPRNFTAVTSRQSASIDLSWSSVVGATRYEIQRSSAYNFISSFTTIETISDMTMTNYIDTSNLINGKTYYYKISASDARSTTSFSSLTHSIPLLTAPDNFMAVTGEEYKSIHLSWTCVVGASGYEIQRSSTNNDQAVFTTIETMSDMTMTNYVDTSNLIKGQIYYYKIVTSDGRSTDRFSLLAHTIPALTSPDNVKAVTGQESASIHLSWSSVGGATGYAIQRSSTNNDQAVFTTIKTISDTTMTNYVDKLNLINGQTYYYRIVASDGTSTDQFSLLAHAVPALTAPGNVNAVTGRESASIHLSWSSVTDANSYEIQRSSANDDEAIFTKIATIWDTTMTNYIDISNLINGKAYYYKIAACNDRSTGRFSLIVHAVPKLTAPSNFKAVTGLESASIDLSWASVASATGYEIQRSAANNDGAVFTTIKSMSDTTMTNYVDTSNLINGKTYYYKIRACNGRSTGQFSLTVDAVPKLRPPGNLAAVTGEESASIHLSWVSVVGATGYEIQRSWTNNDRANFTTISIVSNGLSTNYTDRSNLINTQTYYYRIAAIDDRCTSRFSLIVHAISALAAPSNFNAVTSRESACIDLFWASVVGASGYDIQRSSTNNDEAAFTTIVTILNTTTTTTTNYVDKSNLIIGETYYYKIAARDGRSTGRFSLTVDAFPALTPPGNLTAVTGEESASIYISWTTVAGATGYEIQRSSTKNDDAKFSNIATISNKITTNYVDKSNLINGETYYYKIATRYGPSTGRFSLRVEAVPELTPPCNVTAVTGQASASIYLSWVSVVGATGYEIQRSSTNNDRAVFITIKTISDTTMTNYVDKSNLINGQTYYYKIASMDGRCTSRFSSVVNAGAHICPPRNVQARPYYGSCTVLLRWDTIEEATGYNIKRSSTADTVPEETIEIVLDGSVSAYADQKLTDGCRYYYVMTSIDGTDESVYTSNIVSAVPSVNEPTSSIRVSDGEKGIDFKNMASDAISVRKGDLTKEMVDAIVIASSSSELRKTILKAAGPLVEQAYQHSVQANSGNSIIVTPSGQLLCQHIFFLEWQPQNDSFELQKSLKDFVCKGIENARKHNCSTIAFPAIGCGQYGCSIRFVAETMISEARSQLQAANDRIKVIFILQKDRDDLYDAFTNCLGHYKKVESQLPPTWEPSTGNQLRYLVANNAVEYKSVLTNFDRMMKGSYTQIIKLERIQNKRWFMQYSVHREEFIERLKSDTEKILYHGCPEQAADSIIEDCFNRSFAGVNGTVYGFGVYFSSNAAYSHGYARNNAKGERCMFVSRVLVGKSTVGNHLMRTRPVGFDSTTDGKSIFVTYHDAQAYAEYLITYK